MTEYFFKSNTKSKFAHNNHISIDWEKMLEFVKIDDAFPPTAEIELICKIVQARSLDAGYQSGFAVVRAD